MKQLSIWAAVYSLTQTTAMDEAAGQMDSNTEKADEFTRLTSGQTWSEVRSDMVNREDADRMLEIAEEWCSFPDSERAERQEEMEELFCFSTETKTIADAISHLDSNDEWEDFIDMINDPEIFEQDGVPATKEGMLELVEVSFGTDALG